MQGLRRANAGRQLFEMDLRLDFGPYALGIDTRVLQILKRGIDSESQHRIPEILSSRREARNERFRGASFETSLGFGCISYLELDDDDRTREV